MRFRAADPVTVPDPEPARWRTLPARRDVLRMGGFLGTGVGLSYVLGGCLSPSGGGSSSTGKRSLTLAFNRSLPTLDNKLNQYDAQVTVERAVHQALTRIGPSLRLENVLAESFEMTKPTVWTVRLRQGAAYSDGTPVKPQDVATALTMYQKTPASYVATQFSEMPRVVPVDARTFQLVTKEPMVTLDYLMSNILLMPAAKNQPRDTDGTPGTGPFVIKAQNKGAGTFDLVPNTHYSGTKPSLTSVRLRFIEQDSVRVDALKRGEIDIMDSVPPDVAKQLESASGITLARSAGTRIEQLFYNFRKPSSDPLSDPKVREALSYAIDGETILKNVLLGSCSPIKGVVPQSLVGAAQVGQYAYDPGRAKSMLSQLGVSNLKLKLIWETGEFFSDAQVMEAIAEMLGKAGVKSSLKQFQPGGDIMTWRSGRGGDWDVLGNGYGNQTGLAITDLQGMYAGTAAKEKTRDTYQGYIVPKATKLINAAAAESDESKRTSLLQQAQETIWASWPCMWAFVQNNALAHRNRVKGVDLLPTNFYDLASVSVSA